MNWFNDVADREREKNKVKVEADIVVEQDVGRDRCVTAHVVTEVEDPIRRDDVPSRLS